MSTLDSQRPYYGSAIVAGTFNGLYYQAIHGPVNIGAAGTTNFSFTSPDIDNIFIKVNTASPDSTITIQTGATLSGGTTAIFENPNFNIKDQPALSIVEGVTIDVAGTTIWERQIIGLGDRPQIQGIVGDSEYFVTERNVVYTYTVTNNDVATDYIVDISTARF
jgi:hypothetical protein